jgi:hypothetical protein
MKKTLKNTKKVAMESLRNIFKKKNKVEEGGASSSRVKRE